MSTQIYNPIDNRAFRGTTVDVQSSTMNNGMGGSHLKLNQPKQASKALLGSATKAAKFGKVLGPAGTIFNAGVSIATADKSQGAAGIAGDVFAETGGYMLGAAKGAALGTMIAPGIGTVIGGIGGGLLGSGAASWGMDQVQNLWRQNTSSKTGGLPADYKETEQKSFEDAAKFRNSPAPSTNPNGIKQSGTSMTIGDFEKNLGVIVSNTAAKDFESNPLTRREELQLDSNRDSLGALRQAEARRGIVNQGSDAGNRMRFVRTDDGLQRITKEGYQARMSQQAGTALDEGFVDKYKYDPTADKGVQKWMGKSKAEIDAAYDKMTDAEKKAEGMNMHKAFMASKNSGSTTSTNSISSGNPFGTNFSGPQQQNIRGSGMKNRRLGTFQSAHDQHTNFSGDQQTNERGSGQPGGRSVEDVFSRPDHKNFSGPKQNNKRGSGKRDAAQKALSRSQAHNGINKASDSGLNFESVYNMAKNSGAKYPELVAAQFQLESGGGTSELARKHNNLFGQKGKGVNYNTKEDGSNGMYEIKDDFKTFNNPQESVNYLVDRWYKDYDQYKGINNASNADEAAKMLSSQGYATDRNYTNKLTSILRQKGY